MLSSEFLVELAQKVYGTLSALEGRARSLDESEGVSLDSGAEISAPHILSGLAWGDGQTCSFVGTLFDLMEAKGVSDAELSAKMGWPEETLVALRADKSTCPLRELVFAFGLALALNREEMGRLMASAGFALSNDEVYDIIVLHCMDRGVFDLDDVNEALRCFNLKPIGLRPLKGRPAPLGSA